LAVFDPLRGDVGQIGFMGRMGRSESASCNRCTGWKRSGGPGSKTSIRKKHFSALFRTFPHLSGPFQERL